LPAECDSTVTPLQTDPHAELLGAPGGMRSFWSAVKWHSRLVNDQCRSLILTA